MINPHTKFEVSMFNDYEHMKGNAKCQKSTIFNLTHRILRPHRWTGRHMMISNTALAQHRAVKTSLVHQRCYTTLLQNNDCFCQTGYKDVCCQME